jgi:drug/metabolite transporter (DMT)-like permease
MLTRNHWLGIGASILAGAFWGLVFLTPELTRGFTPIQLSAGRYLAYGLVAAALLAPSWRKLRPMLGWRDWRTLGWLSLAGNIVYYVFLANAVQLGGVAMTSLIIGLLPVTVTLAGRRDADAAPMLRLLPSLALGVAGLVCISWQSLSAPQHGSMQGAMLGLLCAVGALVSWTLYAVGNSRALTRLHGVSAHDWSLLVGVVTGAQALLLAVPAFVVNPGVHSSSAWLVLRRRGHHRRDPVLGGRQRAVEPRQPPAAAHHDRADDRLRDPVRAAVRLHLGAAPADRAGMAGDGAADRGCAELCVGAPGARVPQAAAVPT